ncbi:MAG TPA: DUF2723 domain-containing protein [Anaerolineae bacterium]
MKLRAHKLDALLAGLLGLVSLALYIRTAAPSVAVLFDDTLEFQVVIPTLGIAHPSGYPLYTLLGKLFTLLLPFRDAAGRLNLFSAFAAAAAVAFYYLAARRLVHSRLPALIVAGAFAISPAWWSQATLAEVYALFGLLAALFLYLLLSWEDATAGRQPGAADGRLAAAAIVAGLGLTHHRMSALFLPAALVLIVWTDPSLLRQPRRWVRPLLCGLAPLLLYLYLPIRGRAVSSLDGTFVPTIAGSVSWMMARPYYVFLTGNPFNVHRGVAFFLGVFEEQFGIVVFGVAILGLLTAWRLSMRRFVFLLLATAAAVAFGAAYKVQDIEVFLLPAIMLVGLWAAFGLLFILDQAGIYVAAAARSLRLPAGVRPFVLGGGAVLVAAGALVLPFVDAAAGFRDQDLSQSWQVYDLGQDMVASAAPGGEIVGLGGEVTLVRYLRDVLGERTDLAVVRSDAEAGRYAAIESALAAGQPVYLTRDLPGVAARYSLAAEGPLIRVLPKARPGTSPAAGRPVAAGITLISARSEMRTTHTGPVVRLDLAWSTSAPIKEQFKVSARLLDASGKVVVQNDQVPVHFTYPTTAWVPGEVIPDVYDLALPARAPAGPYLPLLILYRAADGSEVGRAELPALGL